MIHRVCFIFSTFPPISIGGVEKYLLYIIKVLTEKGISSTLLTRYYPPLPKKENHKSYTLYRIGITPFPKSNKRYISGFTDLLGDRLTYTLLGFYEAIKLVKDVNIVHPQLGGVYDFFLGEKIANKLQKPLIVTIHGKFGQDFEDIPPKEELLKALRQATFILVNRKSSYNFLTNLGLSNIFMMQNPIPFHEYKRPHVLKKDIEKQNVRITFVGRLCYRRGAHIAVRSFIYAAKECPHIELWVIGDGPLRSQLLNEIRKFGLQKRAVFFGNQFDVKRFLWNSDIFLATSPIDNFPSLSLREAMAAGLSVIATDAGETKDIIFPNENGILVSPDPRAVGNAILRLVNDKKLRCQLADAAVRSAEKFDLYFYCQKLLELYKKAF